MRLPVPEERVPAGELRRVHLIGLGGAGLSGIARLMLARGVEVSGSDGVDSPTLAALRALGATAHHGHDARHLDHLRDGDVVVVSTAVHEDNPEYREAVRRGLRIWPRSTALVSVMLGRTVVAVAGTHGKTTTTSLLTVALQEAGADPAYAIGGDLAATGVNAADGSGPLFVAEADESDGAFLHYRPHAAIVTNVDADHLDTWGTPEAYAAAFDDFVATLDPDGFLVVVADDPGAAALGTRHEAAGGRVLRVSARSDDGVDLGPAALDGVRLWSPGEHYRADALAALATGLELGHDRDALRRGLAAYTGTKRRMERKGEAAGVRVYDSYAHHPTEIVGDLEAARAIAGEGRVLVAFQPHLVSRTRIFAGEMGAALGAADEVVVLDVYLAREPADPAVTGALVADAVPLPDDRVVFEADRDRVVATLVERARPGDLVLTLGAGDVTALGPQVLARLGADA
ncbi:UDP-N-acetylmuramate--L-alanine ligase [Nocardioides sp. TRM66260-LWL]|uniref:UDP-N-acetylmuramate--L-alanine ligase n=1 Tax=Nocardioides sp. TRM66260-LWL TaxID=2874478 RepID=UPI001CC62CC1|nr:UDP-N-acetylmuramate--L-alanine ligase [Nocardioides sp. TRM66260-LWL]MBZ5733349.1 UDP-N-acetylmuramate--L-alanine ligase [Nocardioides sp. TRM66260-LWL]